VKLKTLEFLSQVSCVLPRPDFWLGETTQGEKKKDGGDQKWNETLASLLCIISIALKKENIPDRMYT
jgi:hypothetical protein